MTLPLLTWRVSANYPLVPIGTSPTMTELLTAINAMLVAETALGGYWGVSDFNSGNGTLEVKRNGSPTGTLASFRALMFGGTSPNASALFAGVTAGASVLFAGACENASTTGPTGSYTTGSPYAGLKWTGAGPMATLASFTKANNIFLFMVESDEICHIHVADASGSSCFTFGACVEKLSDNTRVWSAFTSGSSKTSATSYGAGTESDAGNWLIARYVASVTAYASQPIGAWHDGTNQRYISRVNGIGGVASVLADSTGGWLMPIVVADKIATVANDPLFLGQLRQMRYGPMCINKCRIVDGVAIVQAYGVSWGAQTTARAALYFDVQQ